jgi:hypothetical protein
MDISNHRSRTLTVELVQQADYIFGMTHSHVDTIVLLYPQAAEKTFLLREFDETVEPFEKDISDPIGGSYEVYENCRDQIEQGIASMLKFMDRTTKFCPPRTTRNARRPHFAMGADHGGYQLKEALKQYLQSRGEHHRLGRPGPRPAAITRITPRRSGEAVAGAAGGIRPAGLHHRRRHEHAANKVPGIRAALVADESMAALARQHNDANVLCLRGKNTRPNGPENPGRLPQGRSLRADATNGACSKWSPTRSAELRLRAVDPIEIAEAIEPGAPAPAGKHRVDRQREFCQPGGDGSPGLGADQQIRRRAIPANAGTAAAKTWTRRTTGH